MKNIAKVLLKARSEAMINLVSKVNDETHNCVMENVCDPILNVIEPVKTVINLELNNRRRSSMRRRKTKKARQEM